MKKLLPLIIIISLNLKTQAQVVFCPPGAEWHYVFNFLGFVPGTKYNESIKYTGDTIEGADTLKILRHQRLFLQCSPLITRTLIKQKGDTVFIKNNRTQNGWQILYNFAALPGQSWTTSVLQNNASISTFTFSVDSVKFINVNGFSLKNLYVTKTGFSFLPTAKIQITERLGGSQFLFDFDNIGFGSCDADYFEERLCYQDNSFGLMQFTSKPCDYNTANIMGINEENKALYSLNRINMYPNPAKDLLSLDEEDTQGLVISFMDVFGREVKKESLRGNKTVDIANLKPGVYQAITYKNKAFFSKSKILKE